MRKSLMIGCVAALALAVCSWHAGWAKEPNVPASARGFSGMVYGKIIAKEELGFVMEVGKIVEVWKGNKAPKPESLIGRKVLINVQWVEGDDGQWHPNENHLQFVRWHRPGDQIHVEVVNDELDRLHILEL